MIGLLDRRIFLRQFATAAILDFVFAGIAAVLLGRSPLAAGWLFLPALPPAVLVATVTLLEDLARTRSWLPPLLAGRSPARLLLPASAAGLLLWGAAAALWPARAELRARPLRLALPFGLEARPARAALIVAERGGAARLVVEATGLVRAGGGAPRPLPARPAGGLAARLLGTPPPAALLGADPAAAAGQRLLLALVLFLPFGVGLPAFGAAGGPSSVRGLLFVLPPAAGWVLLMLAVLGGRLAPAPASAAALAILVAAIAANRR